MRTFFVFCVALGSGCFLLAQSGAPLVSGESPALNGKASNGQTEILSDNGGEFYYKLKTYIYRGNVRVDNPQMKLTCELLTVESPELKEGKFNRATAETNVVIDWLDDKGQPNHATAQKAVYTYSLTNLATLPQENWQTNSLVVLTGNPIVTNAQYRFEGDPINWDRIKDVISSPHMVRTSINPTNTSGMFETPTSRTNSPAK